MIINYDYHLVSSIFPVFTSLFYITVHSVPTLLIFDFLDGVSGVAQWNVSQ